MRNSLAGRKVFILNPHSVVTEELVGALLAAEYEVYLLTSREKALHVLRKFPHSVLFINIDSGATAEQWESYVRRIMAHPLLGTVRIGILSHNPSPGLAERYLMEIGVPCGFVRLKLGIQESTRIMLATLQANEAKGRRKYVRVTAEGDRLTGFNVRYGQHLYEGSILDLSSVGMAARFHVPMDILPNTKLSDIQLRLRSTPVRLNGIVLNRRAGDKSVYVILFEHTIETKAKSKIRLYIHRRLQEEVDRIIAEAK